MRHHLCSEVFGHAGLLDEGSAGFLQTSGVVRQQARGFDLRRHVGDLVLHPLDGKKTDARRFCIATRLPKAYTGLTNYDSPSPSIIVMSYFFQYPSTNRSNK